MRGVVVGFLTIFVVVALLSAGCSHRSKKHKKEPLQITTTSLPDATEGVSYSATIEAAGGTTPYTWTVSGLPSGLTWSQVGDAVEIGGTPDVGTAGTYNVDVTVTDSSSPAQSASATLQLVVNPAGGTTLKADFEASPTYGKAPLTVNFTDKSTGNLTSWEWDFDNDGTVDSTDQNPTFIYNDPGWYTVKLTVSDGTSSDSCVKEMYIQVAANVYYVDGVSGDDGNGGTDWSDAFATIGKALDVAGDYDLVLVADATYNEINLYFFGRKIYLKGIDHNTAGAQPVVDCQDAGRAFFFTFGETEDCVVDNFTIRNGSADKGGAIYCENSSNPTIINCVFASNRATNWCGGAIYCNNSCSLTLVNCRFVGNGAESAGGAIGCEKSSGAAVTNCIFSDNSAKYTGGAIYCDQGSLDLTNCIFCDNHSGWDGGAVYCCLSNVTINNCKLTGNSAGEEGGAFVGVYSSSSIINCTFNGNSSDCGGAIYCRASSSATLNNCIVWGNTASTSGNEIYIYDSGSSCTLNYCCVDNTGYGGQTGNITENNCIYDDPQFVDAANGDYHLKDTSPCIDAGNNSYVPSGVDADLEGNERIVDGDNDGTATVDIGAYEYQP